MPASHLHKQPKGMRLQIHLLILLNTVKIPNARGHHDCEVKTPKSSHATINLLLRDLASVLLLPQGPCQNLSIKKGMSCELLKLVGTEVILHYTELREESAWHVLQNCMKTKCKFKLGAISWCKVSIWSKQAATQHLKNAIS